MKTGFYSRDNPGISIVLYGDPVLNPKPLQLLKKLESFVIFDTLIGKDRKVTRLMIPKSHQRIGRRCSFRFSTKFKS